MRDTDNLFGGEVHFGFTYIRRCSALLARSISSRARFILETQESGNHTCEGRGGGGGRPFENYIPWQCFFQPGGHSLTAVLLVVAVAIALVQLRKLESYVCPADVCKKLISSDLALRRRVLLLLLKDSQDGSGFFLFILFIYLSIYLSFFVCLRARSSLLE